MHNVFIILILHFEMMIWNDDMKDVDQAITNLSWILPCPALICGIRYTNPESEMESQCECHGGLGGWSGIHIVLVCVNEP